MDLTMILTAIITGISFGIIVMLAMFTGIAILNRRLSQEKTQLLVLLKAYFESPDENTPSQFAALTELLSERFSQKLLHTFKTSFLGQASVDSKNIARLEGDMLQDMAMQKNPVLGVIMSQFPSLARRLSKNPGLLPLVQSLMPKPPGINNEPKQASFSDMHSY